MPNSTASREAEAALRKPLEIAPENAAAQLNLGMLLGEEHRMQEAEAAFRAAISADPRSAAAAYNLAVLLAPSRLDEAIRWARKAYEASPEPKYGVALAVYLRQAGQTAEADAVLRGLEKSQTINDSESQPKGQGDGPKP